MKHLSISPNADKHLVCVCYRVNQHWRAPLFRFLSQQESFDFKLLVSDDFLDSKVHSGPFDGISYKKFRSVNIDFRLGGKRVQVPYSIGLFRFLLSEKPSLIFTEGRSNFLNNIKCVIYCLLFHRPVYQWGLGELRSTSFLSRLLSRPFQVFERASSGAIVYSTQGASYYKETVGMDPVDVHIAVNTIDDRNIEAGQARSVPLDSFNFLFVGAIEPQKRVPMLIHAFSNVLTLINSSSCELTPVLNIIGAGSELKLCETLVDDLGIRSSVNFKGPLFGRELRHYFNVSHLLVMPGLGGLVVSEAVCHNLPVLCSMGDGSEIDWLSGGAGIISCFQTPGELAQDMLQILLNPGVIADMSGKCMEARSRLGFDSYANVFLGVINDNISVR